MNNLYDNKNILLKKVIVIIGFLSILAIVFLCSLAGTMPSLKESHGMSTMPVESNASLNHASYLIELTSFTTRNISSISVIYLFLLIISIVLFSSREKLYSHFLNLLSASNFFIRKRLEIFHIARQSFYSWYSLFERAPNTTMAT